MTTIITQRINNSQSTTIIHRVEGETNDTTITQVIDGQVNGSVIVAPSITNSFNTKSQADLRLEKALADMKKALGC